MLTKNQSRKLPKAFKGFKGTELIDKIIDIDQSPIKNPRSNPATYTGAFGPIWDWFANLPGSKLEDISWKTLLMSAEDVKLVRVTV